MKGLMKRRLAPRTGAELVTYHPTGFTVHMIFSKFLARAAGVVPPEEPTLVALTTGSPRHYSDNGSLV
jgi:hypothetical protein